MKSYIMHTKTLASRMPGLMSGLDASHSITEYHIISSEDFHLEFSDIQHANKLGIKNIPEQLANHNVRPLSRAEKSIFKKHVCAYTSLSESTHELAMILEDDVIFNPKDIDKFIYCNLPAVSLTLARNWDMIFFGSGMHEPDSRSGLFIQEKFHKSKCADSYLITRKAARLLLDDMHIMPPFLPIDWDISLRCHRLGLTVIWKEPGIIQQGSQTGIFKSSIQHI